MKFSSASLLVLAVASVAALSLSSCNALLASAACNSDANCPDNGTCSNGLCIAAEGEGEGQTGEGEGEGTAGEGEGQAGEGEGEGGHAGEGEGEGAAGEGEGEGAAGEGEGEGAAGEGEGEGVADPCAPGVAVTATSNDALASFAGCTEITVNLTISGGGVSSTGALSSVQVVNGSLTINDADNANYEGIGHIQTITGDLRLNGDFGNALGHFNALQNVDGDVRIENTELFTIDGFPLLQTIGGDLRIRDNGNLSSIAATAFAVLTDIVGGVVLDNNPNLPCNNARLVVLEGLASSTSTGSGGCF